MATYTTTPETTEAGEVTSPMTPVITPNVDVVDTTDESDPKPFLLVPCDPRLVGFVLGKNRSWIKETGQQAKGDGFDGAFIAWLPPRDQHYGCFKVTAATQDGVDHLFQMVKDKEKHGLNLLETGKFIPRRQVMRQDRRDYDDRRQNRRDYDGRRQNRRNYNDTRDRPRHDQRSNRD